MTEIVGNRKISGLNAFLDSLVKKGRAKSSVVVPLKTAVHQIFETVEKDNWENLDVAEIDLDDYMIRFKNLALNRYNERSYNSYKARANRALTWYNNFLQNPGWTPQIRKSPASNKSQNGQSSAKKSTIKPIAPATNTEHIPESPLGNNDLISFPFPLSNGSLASLYLPKQLSKEDAERLSQFISSLVIGEKKQ